MKRFVITFIMAILFGLAHAQNSVAIHQGSNVLKYHLSDIDSITHGHHSLNIHQKGEKVGYSVLNVDSVSFIQTPLEGMEGTAKIILNADDPKVVTLTKNSGEILHFYGKKDERGAVEYFTHLEYISTDGLVSLVEFDERGKIVSFYAPNGVTIAFEWIDDDEAVVKVFNPEDNSYIITNWNIKEAAYAPTKPVHNDFIPRTGDLVMTQITGFQPMHHAASHVFGTRMYDVRVKKCDSPVDAKVWIKIVEDENRNETITSVYDAIHVDCGWYYFHIPDWTFPTTMPNKELIDNIDSRMNIILNAIAECAGNGSLLVTINGALMISGIGMVPAVVAMGLEAFIILGSNVLGNIDELGWFFRKFNPDWYFQEETHDIFVIPYVNGQPYPEEGFSVSFEDDTDWGSLVNLEGDPQINEFMLFPSNPSSGQGYKATVYYKCIPHGSRIVMGIEGTDGYHNETTQMVESSTGAAELKVPGANKGVHDICTATIYDTNGSVIASTSASLTFR